MPRHSQGRTANVRHERGKHVDVGWIFLTTSQITHPLERIAEPVFSKTRGACWTDIPVLQFSYEEVVVVCGAIQKRH